MSQYLFVYGTLQPRHAPAKMARLAAKLRPVGKGFIRGVLYDLGEYPGAVPDLNAKRRIAGTVMELPQDKSVLRELDAFEGFDPEAPERSEFVRQQHTVELSAGEMLECWIYRYNGKPDATCIIASGVWQK
jgi:gamma-glutamylcyclotransferase (GGCT)/AIG2-like uncharacterized protein YtfP